MTTDYTNVMLDQIRGESIDWTWPPAAGAISPTIIFGGDTIIFGGDTTHHRAHYGPTPAGHGDLPRDPITGQLR